MKRLALLFICCIFIGYLLAFLSALGAFRSIKVPIVTQVVAKARRFSGLGGLFVQAETMRNYETCYQFYYNGKWHNWLQLETPLFEEYKASGRLASLKHNRLDKRLVARVLSVKKRFSNVPVNNTQPFKALQAHILYAHGLVNPADSIRVEISELPANAKRVIRLKIKSKI